MSYEMEPTQTYPLYTDEELRRWPHLAIGMPPVQRPEPPNDQKAAESTSEKLLKAFIWFILLMAIFLFATYSKAYEDPTLGIARAGALVAACLSLATYTGGRKVTVWAWQTYIVT
ncbi:unnamed protein product [Sympodiomycopsis kandeliae]